MLELTNGFYFLIRFSSRFTQADFSMICDFEDSLFLADVNFGISQFINEDILFSQVLNATNGIFVLNTDEDMGLATNNHLIFLETAVLLINLNIHVLSSSCVVHLVPSVSVILWKVFSPFRCSLSLTQRGRSAGCASARNLSSAPLIFDRMLLEVRIRSKPVSTNTTPPALGLLHLYLLTKILCCSNIFSWTSYILWHHLDCKPVAWRFAIL